MDLKTGRAAFLGLDGTPYTLVKDLISKGVMPNLAAVAADGAIMQMDTTLPEVSSVAWTTFMTGVNPAAHGIYGFMELKPGTYDMYFPNSGHIRARTLWDRLGDAGRRSVVLNVPSTYPARPLNGVLTAGFVALDLKKATYPESAYEYLSGIGYRIDVDTRKAREDSGQLADDLRLTLAKRREAILHYLSGGEWDLFIGVVTETDRLHHFLWDAYADEAHPMHGFFLDYYREIDGLIGEFADVMGARHPGVPYMIMSDHGFTLIETEVYLNHWLREQGYQDLAVSPAGSLNDLGAATRAFALDPSRIYVNLKGSYPRGTVAPGDERERLVQEISARLMQLEHGGKKVVRAVFRKEDLYSGPCIDAAPDLVVLSNHGFDLKGSMAKAAIFDRGFLTGMHTQDDAVLVLSRELASGETSTRPNILDVTATLADALGLDAFGQGGIEGRRLGRGASAGNH